MPPLHPQPGAISPPTPRHATPLAPPLATATQATKGWAAEPLLCAAIHALWAVLAFRVAASTCSSLAWPPSVPRIDAFALPAVATAR
jgi:hypothetical protein